MGRGVRREEWASWGRWAAGLPRPKEEKEDGLRRVGLWDLNFFSKFGYKEFEMNS